MSKRGRPRNFDGTVYQRTGSAYWWIRYPTKEGGVEKESTGTTDREEAQRFLRSRLEARDQGRLPVVLASRTLTFAVWADWFLERRSKPPFRTQSTHDANLNALKSLKPVFGALRLSDITAEGIENYLHQRLNSERRIHTKLGIVYRGRLKPGTVHQEFRILRRILNVAVKQKRLAVNPCHAVEFPVSVLNSVRKPHYMTATEQAKIEAAAPSYLKNIIVIISEMGLRPFKELLPMRKCQVDLENRLVHIPDSKTPSGIGDMPMSEPAWAAFRSQIEEAADSDYLFPARTGCTKEPYMTSLRKTWEVTLKRAGVTYFALYELRHTFATRLSAGGVADHFVSQMLRQGDAGVFKRYSQAKFNMMREALNRLDRKANEHPANFGTVKTA